MKFSIDSLFKGKELPPQKKRVLAIGGVAFIVLLFVSFLLSLSEGDNNISSNDQTQNTVTNNQVSDSLPLPSSQRYDFESSGQVVGDGLESLLNDAPKSEPSNIGVDNNPFANMNGSGTSNERQDNLGSQADDKEDFEMLVAPQEAKQIKTSLYCDSYSTSAAAESQKAVLAFQGISASIITNKDGSYGLKLGPFDDDKLARETFNDLANKGLLQRCALVKQ